MTSGKKGLKGFTKSKTRNPLIIVLLEEEKIVALKEKKKICCCLSVENFTTEHVNKKKVEFPIGKDVVRWPEWMSK